MSKPNRTALITGAAMRVGATLAEYLASQGYDLVLHANSSISKLQDNAKALKATGCKVTCVTCDFADRTQAAKFADQVLADHAIDLVINNASLFRNDRLPDVTDQMMEDHMNVNFHAPRLLMTAFWQQCEAQGREGHVINLLDHKLRILNPDFFSYTMSKVALGTLTKTAAMQFAPHVRVNSISPGIALISGKQSQEDFEASWASAPMGRSATPQQIANAALFLDQNPAIHGEDIVIDGGQSLYQLPRDIAFLAKTESKTESKTDNKADNKANKEGQ